MSTALLASVSVTWGISAAMQCGLNLHSFVNAQSNPGVVLSILENSHTDDTETLELIMAIAAAESHFNNNAVSPVGARGILQLMPGAIKDGAAFCGIPVPRDPYSLKNNIRLGTCYIKLLLHTFDGDTLLAIAAFNGGYRQAQNLASPGKRLASETAQYIPQVMYYKRTCQNLDKMRENKTRFNFDRDVMHSR